jgi:hypothetical protein
MPVDAADVEELRRVAAERNDLGTCQPLDSIPEILAYAVAVARAENLDEADAVEMLARAARLSRDDLLGAHQVLAPLGYGKVCARLKQLARRKRCH